MALNVTDLRNGTFYKEGKDILLVLTYEHVKTGRGSGNIKLKVRNIRTGSVTEKSFITGARVDEANVELAKKALTRAKTKLPNSYIIEIKENKNTALAG